MKIFRTILGFGLLASSFVGQTASTAGDAGGAVLNYGGAAVKNVGSFAEGVGYYTRAGSQWVGEKSANLASYSEKLIFAQDGYNHQTFEFKNQLVEDSDSEFGDYVLFEPRKYTNEETFAGALNIIY